MYDAKTGKTYGAGVALATVKKRADAKPTAAARNPKGTPKELFQCTYFRPLYCTTLGHSTASSKECAMKIVSPSDRKEVLVKIKKMQLNEELEVALQENGKSTRLQYSMTYLLFVLLNTNFI